VELERLIDPEILKSSTYYRITAVGDYFKNNIGVQVDLRNKSLEKLNRFE